MDGLDTYNRAYFLGIGGIGMSALARYFNALGWEVAGYDKTPSALTDELQQEGIDVHFDDWGPSIPNEFLENDTLVVYTPAIPRNMGELLHFMHKEVRLFKRSEVLGLLTKSSKGLGVAGTHGKTTTSSMLTNILSGSEIGCSAFLGGIATNLKSNVLINEKSDYTVVEADEFDRSFLALSPYCSIITSADPDHLDIYGDEQFFKAGFEAYAQLINPKGCLVKHESISFDQPLRCTTINYASGSSTADYSLFNLSFADNTFMFDVKTPDGIWEKVTLGIPGEHNAENALACIALCNFLGVKEEVIREGLAGFLGVKRRFEYHLKSQKLVYIDDYAHHPTEIKALLGSVKQLYPDKKLIGIFQPHLFSRTRDFFDQFAEELSALDKVILLPIYAAREEPIDGINSERLLEKITSKDKLLCEREEVVSVLADIEEGVVLTIGAGDIDRIVEPLKRMLHEKVG